MDGWAGTAEVQQIGTEAGVRGRARGGDSGAEYLGGDGEEAMAAEIKKRPNVGGGREEERSGHRTYIRGSLVADGVTMRYRRLFSSGW